MYKYELHAHTCQCDKVATISGEQLVEAYHHGGYNGLVITDHYFSLFFDWFGEELTGKTKEEIITRWLKGYYTAKNAGEKIGFTVLPGAEVRSPETLFGIEGYNGSNPPIRNQLAKVFASHYGKPITSGSDCHHLHAVGKGGIVTQTPILCPADLRLVLKEGRYTLIEP